MDHGLKYLDRQAEFRMEPEDGLLLLFPSYLRHYQSLYTGRKDRIIIGFNSQIWRISSGG